MVNELLDDVSRARLGSHGSTELTHRMSDGSVYAVMIEPRGAGYRVAGRVGAAAVPTPAPVPVPVPDRGSSGLPAALLALLHRLEHAGASDLFLSTGQRPRWRIAGELAAAEAPADETWLSALAAAVLDDARRAQLDATGSCDAALELASADGPLRLRVNVFRQRAGLAIAVRPVRRDAPTLASLHLPDELAELTRHKSGLVLVTGRAGSGKSTTLVALVEHLNRTRGGHVITLEDPIEHAYVPHRCLIHQREVGAHVDSFASGLRAALRESPDVILVGEMRDRETIALALTAAETGHLVLSTMHCASAAVAVNRILDVFPEGQQPQIRGQLAATLRAVLTQVLVPGVTPPARLPAHEVLTVSSGVAANIREGKVHQLATAIQTGRDDGMVPLERTLATLVRAGRITRAAARDAANDVAALDQLMGR
jgi:twitching motility protein PilT